MGFDGVLGDEEAGGDFSVAEPLGYEGEDFEFARGDAEGVELGLVEGEVRGWWVGGDKDFPENDFFAGLGELDAEPDAERGEEDRDNCGVDFEGVLEDEELIFGVAEDGDEDAAYEAEEKDVAKGAAGHGGWVDFTAARGCGAVKCRSRFPEGMTVARQ